MLQQQCGHGRWVVHSGQIDQGFQNVQRGRVLVGLLQQGTHRCDLLALLRPARQVGGHQGQGGRLGLDQFDQQGQRLWALAGAVQALGQRQAGAHVVG